MDREIANIKYIQKPKLDEFPYENLKNLTKPRTKITQTRNKS